MTALAAPLTQTSRMNVANPLASLLIIVLMQPAFSGAASAEPAADAPAATLVFLNGDRLTGTLVDSAGGQPLSWKSPGFSDHLRFPLDGVQGVRFPVPEKLPQVESDYSFELTGGDMLFGSLISVDETTVVIESPGLGTLHVARDVLLRIDRRTSSSTDGKRPATRAVGAKMPAISSRISPAPASIAT